MPRRPRPARRAPPRGKPQARENRMLSSRSFTRTVQNNQDSASESDKSDLEAETDEERIVYTDEDEDDMEARTESEEDADLPRVSQWVDEDELEPASEEVGEEVSMEAGPSQLEKLQHNLSNIPFGALRKAQNALVQAEAVTDPESSDDDEKKGFDERKTPVVQPSQMEDSGRGKKPRAAITKRSNKHAPMEVTSKRPVSRLRQIVEVKKIEPRDPRFLSITGEFKAEKFQQGYGFLTEAHRDELKALKENLKRAKKMLDNAPRHLREEYEEEARRLELAVKRTESIVNRDRMDRIQQEALHKASKEEREKRKLGKGNWYLKKSEERELVTRAKYESLATEGGQGAVKKAIAKRQKKISQKEKKSRPFGNNRSVGGEMRKRRAEGDRDERKRRKVG